MADSPVVFIQRCLPIYRVEFFSQLTDALHSRLVVIHGRSAPDEGVIEGELPFSVGVANRRLIGLGWWQPGIWGLLTRLSPSAVVCEANPRLTSTFVAARWCNKAGVPLFLWGLGAVPRRRLWLEAHISRRALRTLVRRADGVFAYGPGAKAVYDELATYGVPVWAIGNAARDVDWSERDPRPNAGGSEVDLTAASSGGRRRFLFVGRLIPGKAVDRLLHALHMLQDDRMELEIVGSGPLEPELRELAQNLGVGPVRFLGQLDGVALESAYRRADVFVLPGLGGLTIGEALGYGLPVVLGGDADGASSQLVVDGITGFRARDTSIESLADAIARASDFDDLSSMAVACREAGRTVGNLQAMVKGFASRLKPYLMVTPET